MKRGKIDITAHARRRLKERFPELHESNYQSYVSAARYSGKNLFNKSVNVSAEIKSRFNADNSTRIMFYKNGVFVFQGDHGHARTLVTAVNLNNISDDNN